MILKVLEWQTESSFCTIRVRGKQWYWVYKLSLKDFNNLQPKLFLTGKSSISRFSFLNTKTIQENFHKKIFIKKFSPSSEHYFKKNYFELDENLFNTSKYFFKKNNLFFLKNKNSNIFFIFKNKTNSLKKYNRNWSTIQQQPKTSFFSLKKSKVFKGFNEFLKNSILVKNRFTSTDNCVYLPTRKNITVITNSFDVAHSWFLPGLGLKFDCIPGRSTHHSLFISKPGYYFGHCAEVCGRFHHHMPIKIVALNVDHFLYFYNTTSFSFKK